MEDKKPIKTNGVLTLHEIEGTICTTVMGILAINNIRTTEEIFNILGEVMSILVNTWDGGTGVEIFRKSFDETCNKVVKVSSDTKYCR